MNKVTQSIYKKKVDDMKLYLHEFKFDVSYEDEDFHYSFIIKCKHLSPKQRINMSEACQLAVAGKTFDGVCDGNDPNVLIAITSYEAFSEDYILAVGSGVNRDDDMPITSIETEATGLDMYYQDVVTKLI